jgi:hypothetical protein
MPIDYTSGDDVARDTSEAVSRPAGQEGHPRAGPQVVDRACRARVG